MPKALLYYIGLFLPLVLRVLIFDVDFAGWLEGRGDMQTAELFRALKADPLIHQFIGGWILFLFTITVTTWWFMEEDNEDIPKQFLLLPLAYVPFAIVGNILLTAEFTASSVYVYPLIIIPLGYCYVFTWTVFVYLLDKLHLTI